MTPEALLEHCDRGTLWSREDTAALFTDLGQAYSSALAVRALRQARGERPRGYKIGFTNRTIWDRYQVFAPIWGTVWDSTLTLAEGAGQIDLSRTCQPRIEPEIVFGLRATPKAGATLEDLFDALEWIAPGFEIVQTHAKDWKFTAAETVADGGLHGRLLVGQRRPVRSIASSAAVLDEMLAKSRAVLSRQASVIEEGAGANVLDSPLRALHYFLNALRACPGAPDLKAEDLVTTGTWTDAWPVLPGQQWSVSFSAPLAGLQVTFT